jgi:hypothetical protein
MDDDFEAWKVCFEVNVAFQRKQEADEVSKCVACGAAISRVQGDWASNLYILAGTCGVGHKISQDMNPGICDECDVDLVYRMTARRQECFENDCKRAWTVTLDGVKERLGEVLFSR